MLLRTYARLVAMVLAVAALAGALGWVALGWVALGKGAPLYLFTAIVFAYAGGRWRDAGFTRAVVGSFGAFYLASGLILAVVFGGLEFPFGSGAYAMALGLVIVGGLSTVCARVLPCKDDPLEGPPRKG